MKTVYCSEPFAAAKPDSMYEPEVHAAVAAGLDYELIDYEKLTEGSPLAAVRRVRGLDAPEPAVYRGWMLTPAQYAALYEALKGRNLVLINTPEQYEHCHYLPESYALIKHATPRTVFMPCDGRPDFAAVMRLLATFGDRPVVLKDYVKSRKHEWDEACFIPSASDRAAVERVVNRFLELQDGQVNGGLVFREYVEFEPLAAHSKSGMPLTKEYRLFYFDGALLSAREYWEEGDYAGAGPPVEPFAGVARSINSRFFTMDVAQTKAGGGWLIVELGDAQVAGLPEKTDVAEFYRRLGGAAHEPPTHNNEI